MGKALMVERITVAYDRNMVLRGVTTTAEPGRVLAVTGPSGAGKTTLLWAMAGLVRPVSGEVRVDGVALRDRDHAVTEQAVLVPQDNGLAPILTAGENVQVTLVACGVTPPEARRRTVESLEWLGLSDQTGQPVEVTSELDAQNRQRVLDLLRAEADRGTAVVFATHDPEAAAARDAEVHLGNGCLVDGCLEVVR